MQTAYKFRIYPNKKQIEYFEQCARTKNFIYNHFLRKECDINDNLNRIFGKDKEAKKKARENFKLYFNNYDATKILTNMAKLETYSFLKIIDSTIRDVVSKSLYDALGNIYKIGTGYPNFKKWDKKSYSFTGSIKQNGQKPKAVQLKKCNKKRYLINIPKLKNLKTVIHREDFIDMWDNNNYLYFNSYTVSKTNGHYFISFQADNKMMSAQPKKPIVKDKMIGIDRGVERPVTTSDSNDFNNKLYSDRFDLIKKYKEERKRLSAILNRKRDYHKKNKTGINFWETKKYKEVLRKLNKIDTKIRNTREYRQYEIVNELISKEGADTFVLEKLNIKGMVKRSAKGKSNNKKGLNRVMHDVALYSLETKLINKCNVIGKNVVYVDPKYTSQKCSKCGTINKDNRQSQSVFKCVACGFTENADLNAAINIKEKYEII